MTIQEAHKRLVEARLIMRVESLSRGTRRISACVGTVDEILDVLLFLIETYDFTKSLSHPVEPLSVLRPKEGRDG